MNTSAKMTAFSILAASALGVAAFVGCTTTSTLSDDTDGGTIIRPTPTNDGGNEAGAFTVGSICSTTFQRDPLGSDDCQRCLERNCCTELRGCYNLADDIDAGADGGTRATCEDYSTCVFECRDKPQSCIEDCDLAFPQFKTPYDTLEACGAQTTGGCKTECGL